MYMMMPTLVFGAPNELANPQAVQADVTAACLKLGISNSVVSIDEKTLTFPFNTKKNRDAVISLLAEKYGQAEDRSTF